MVVVSSLMRAIYIVLFGCHVVARNQASLFSVRIEQLSIPPSVGLLTENSKVIICIKR